MTSTSTAMSLAPIRLAGLAALLGACRAVANPDPTMNQPPAPSVLSSADLMGFVATTDGPRCRAFYERVLGLRVHGEDAMAIVLDACGHVIRIQKLRTHAPQPFTVLGWRVRDVRAAATAMTAAGVRFERVPGIPQDDLGIATFPDGTGVAWFKDPDGNWLSVTQYALPMPPMQAPRARSL